MIHAIAAICLVAGISPAATSGSNDSKIDRSQSVNFSDSQVEIYGKLHRHGHSSTTFTPSSASGKSTSATIAPAYVYQYVDGCPSASPTRHTPACKLAVSTCPRGQYLQWLFRRAATSTADADWQQVGSRCAYAPTATAGAAQPVTFPGVTAVDFKQLPLPAGVAHVEPSTGYAIVNVPTNVYASARQVVLPATVVGVAVSVRATPSTYTWSFGDGATLGPTEQTGSPYPDLVLTHSYAAPAKVSITLTTTYTGEYSVAGGPWLPIDGTASVTSAPVAETVLSGHAALVDGTATG